MNLMPDKKMTLFDAFERPLRDLRISVTDRCNFRCRYCMPAEVFGKNYAFLRREALLTFEEIYRVARVLVDCGVRKIRLTGGEPLMRKQVERLIEMLATLGDIDLGLTTNGSFPLAKVQSLRDAGLKRITVSLDSLEDETFQAINDVDFPVTHVLEWIDACAQAGFSPVKINMVVKRGLNESSILPMARYFRARGHILRFIEFMDVGGTNGWRMADVVTAREIVETIHAEMPIEPIAPQYRGEVARRWRYRDGSGEIGIIASVTQAFCRDCTRLRLSADGKLFTCLFATRGHDIRHFLRQKGASDRALVDHLRKIWQRRTDRYSELRDASQQHTQKIEMSYIGG